MKKKAKRMAAGVGAGIMTAAALAVAGAYLLADKGRQRKAKAWAMKARREVAKQVRTARRMSTGEYARLVDRATKRYAEIHDVSIPEARKIARDMKGEWQRLQKNAKVLAAMAGKAVDRPGRKTTKRHRKPVRRASRSRRRK